MVHVRNLKAPAPGKGTGQRRQQGSRNAHLSAKVDHCLLNAISFLHSSGVFVAKRSMSLSATLSCDCLRVRMGSEVVAFDVEACR